MKFAEAHVIDRCDESEASCFVRARKKFTVLLTSDAALVFAGAVAVAALLSTQMLAQPFVWRNFPLDTILTAWFVQFRNRLVIAGSIAVGALAARSLPATSTAARVALVGAGIAMGASAGEYVLLALRLESRIGIGTIVPRVARWSVFAFVVTAMYLLYRRALRTSAAENDAALSATRSERQALEARLQLLRAQIEPHFLFNTLATIRQLHRQESVTGASMLNNLIDYLRAAVPATHLTTATLHDELAHVRAYLGLIEVRMSGRLTSSVECDPSLADHAFPPLALATLVENAVKHGIIPSADGGHIRVIARRTGDFIEAVVVDDGIGLSAGSGGSGIGLANTRARLFSLHGPTARLTLTHHAPRGVEAAIRIPYRAGID